MFKQRSKQTELLDEEGIPRDLLFQNLRELEFINKWLGGLKISLAGLKATASSASDHPIKIADIGCGGGDALRAMAYHAKRKGAATEFIGIDLKQDCIDFARTTCKDFPSVSFVQNDYRDAIRNDDSITHVHAALFCHHLTDEQLVELFQFCKAQNKTLFVNDLQRHPLAYYSIYFLTRLFRGSSLVKNDAPISVLRGFKRKELIHLLEKAGITQYSIRWKWAFRYLIIVPHGQD